MLGTVLAMATELVGGQALVDGVMIRHGNRWAAAARERDGGIVTTVRTHQPTLGRLHGIPVVRGTGALVDSLRIGMAAMQWSREVSRDQVAPPTQRERAIVFGVVSAVLACFLVIPLGVAWVVRSVADVELLVAASEGVARLGVFVAYLAVLSRLPGIRGTLEYHGAEHMVIAAHEHAAPRTRAAAREYSPRHPRCGTDFFLLIFVISILVFALLGDMGFAATVVSRVLAAPLVVGLAYEVLRGAGRHHDTRVGALLAAPGLALQRYTTRTPTDQQIDVALAALETLLPSGREQLPEASVMETM